MSDDTFTMHEHERVVRGTCVIMRELRLGVTELIYAGPIKQSPTGDALTGTIMLLGPEDFELMKKHVKRNRH